MKLVRTITWTRTKLAVATAVTVPLVVGGGFVAANAASPDENRDTSTGTAQLTEEGKKLAEQSGLPSSGSISVGGSADAITGTGPTGGEATDDKKVESGTASGSASLTPEGLTMIEESGLPASASVTAGPETATSN